MGLKINQNHHRLQWFSFFLVDFYIYFLEFVWKKCFYNTYLKFHFKVEHVWEFLDLLTDPRPEAINSKLDPKHWKNVFKSKFVHLQCNKIRVNCINNNNFLSKHHRLDLPFSNFFTFSRQKDERSKDDEERDGGSVWVTAYAVAVLSDVTVEIPTGKQTKYIYVYNKIYLYIYNKIYIHRYKQKYIQRKTNIINKYNKTSKGLKIEKIINIFYLTTYRYRNKICTNI